MKKISFDILRLDRFAQGVHFGDKTTFIQRALPGEKGEASVYRKAKGVEFAWPESITSESSKRIKADCQHYDSCQGCHLRHISHEDELEFKKESFQHELKQTIGDIEVEVLANERVGYRNRIQLHYDQSKKKLGFINSRLNTIVEVPHCLIINKPIKEELERLYKDQKWIKMVPNNRKKGHLELYERNGRVVLTWDQRYAASGFSQVNTKLNNKLYQWIEENIHGQANDDLVLDLFGGGGNLTRSIDPSQKIVIDMYSKKVEKPFINLDLEEAKPIELDKKCGLMIIDPPRRGFKHIEKWVSEVQPESILYISCDVSSLKRDLSQLQGYKAEKAMMIDFFGGTHHYESLVYLTKE